MRRRPPALPRSIGSLALMRAQIELPVLRIFRWFEILFRGQAYSRPRIAASYKEAPMLSFAHISGSFETLFRGNAL